MSVPLDKLTIINAALSATGNNPVLAEGDNSQEWQAGSAAYDRALPVILARHDWKFQTNIVSLVRFGDSPFPGYQDAFSKPADCLHIENVWDTYIAGIIVPIPIWGMSRDGIKAPPMEYRIIGDLINCTTFEGTATALYVQIPNGNSVSALFVEALTSACEALIARSLNEDIDAAKVIGAMAENNLQIARQSNDSEEPRSIPFRSGMLERRRGRRGGYLGVVG